MALLTAEVVARGRLVPSGGPGVRRIRVWGVVEFYISSETARPSLDVLTTIVFAMLFGAMGIAALVLRAGGVGDRAVLCFALAAVGAGYLAADELLAIHESIGHNLQFIRRFPGVERPDDVVLATYAIPVGLFCWVFRDVVLSVRVAVVLFVSGLGVAAVAALSDLADIESFEERAELVTALLISAGLVVVAAKRVPSALRGSSTSGYAGPRTSDDSESALQGRVSPS